MTKRVIECNICGEPLSAATDDELAYASFGQAAERYLATLRFRPGELGGVPVKVWIPYELRFFAP